MPFGKLVNQDTAILHHSENRKTYKLWDVKRKSEWQNTNKTFARHHWEKYWKLRQNHQGLWTIFLCIREDIADLSVRRWGMGGVGGRSCCDEPDAARLNPALLLLQPHNGTGWSTQGCALLSLSQPRPQAGDIALQDTVYPQSVLLVDYFILSEPFFKSWRHPPT